MASRSGTSTPLGTNLKPVDVTASEATLFLPTPLHPNSEAYAETLFKRVVREGVDGWTRERCLAESDAACE
jgi:hypothetical protein